MRLLPIPRAPHDASLPDASLLRSVRDLPARFPEAALRPLVCVRARELEERADRSGATRVWLAMESLQVTGSFKVRGALVAMDAIRARHGKGARVVAASAGNHGAGTAHAARVVGLHARVHVPSSAPRAKRDRIAASGAEVVVCATPHYDDAEALALAEAERDGVPYLSPYDDLDVLAGNGGSLAYEIARAVGRVPDRVIAPLGGGGLLTGLACALADEASEDPRGERRRAWGFQSEACPAAAQSLEAGRAIERLLATDTLADGLEGGISARGFARVRAVAAGVGVVTEASVAAAMAYGVRDLGLVLEGSAACALAPVLEGLPEALRGGDLAVVLTGRNVDGETLERILSR